MTENKRFLIDDAGELIDLNNHKVDLDATEHEHLKPILAKLIKEGWFD